VTALKKYQKLETTGLWRAGPEEKLREVVVSFGAATLVFRDPRSGVALGHWSLAAVVRSNPGVDPALFIPDTDAPSEELEVSDPLLVEAITEVQRALKARRPHPWRMRLAVVALSTALIGAAVWWGVPQALYGHTAKALPFASRVELGRAGLRAMVPFTGQPCAGVEGATVLRKLAQRLNAAGSMQLVVMRDGVHGTVRLPGRLILIDRRLIEREDAPEILAGHVLHALLRDAPDPTERMLREAGLIATVRLLTTGEIPEDRLTDYARETLREPSPEVSDDRLIDLFGLTAIAATPYALSVDPAGRKTRLLIEADPMAAASAKGPAVLTQADWVILQSICES